MFVKVEFKRPLPPAIGGCEFGQDGKREVVIKAGRMAEYYR